MLILLISVMACKKPYDPPAIASTGSYLVVEGVINGGADSTIIKLSRTVDLSRTNVTNPVLHAVVTVENDQNAVFPLTETTGGDYVSAGLNLDNTHKYRLSIKANSEQYYSDFVAVLNSPPIDSVYFTAANNGINIYSNAHDPTNTVKYYRWDYQETWVFHSNYKSGYKSNGDTVIRRNFINDEIYQCWGNDTASTIALGSTANLSRDVITNNPVTFVSSTSEKLGSEYSILVRQYALTGEAYTFWQNLKKNTEQLGGIFDAQPSQINGNIHSVSNPSEPVIGYISVGSTASKRIFIRNQQLPAWVPTNPYPNCQLDSIYLFYSPPGSTVPVNQENEYFNYNKLAKHNLLIPVQAITVIPKIGPEITIGHTGSTPECVDCTLRGTNKQPAFWK